MKKIIIVLIALSTFVLSSCTGVKSTVSGLENESFLSFYSMESYPNGVQVSLNNQDSFNAHVNRMKRNSTSFDKRPSGKVYSIKPGTYDLKVSFENQLIYKRKIFISNQETKTIKL
jgi:hypothetical protein